MLLDFLEQKNEMILKNDNYFNIEQVLKHFKFLELEEMLKVEFFLVNEYSEKINSVNFHNDSYYFDNVIVTFKNKINNNERYILLNNNFQFIILSKCSNLMLNNLLTGKITLNKFIFDNKLFNNQTYFLNIKTEFNEWTPLKEIDRVLLNSLSSPLEEKNYKKVAKLIAQDSCYTNYYINHEKHFYMIYLKILNKTTQHNEHLKIDHIFDSSFYNSNIWKNVIDKLEIEENNKLLQSKQAIKIETKSNQVKLIAFALNKDGVCKDNNSIISKLFTNEVKKNKLKFFKTKYAILGHSFFIHKFLDCFKYQENIFKNEKEILVDTTNIPNYIKEIVFVAFPLTDKTFHKENINVKLNNVEIFKHENISLKNNILYIGSLVKHQEEMFFTQGNNFLKSTIFNLFKEYSDTSLILNSDLNLFKGRSLVLMDDISVNIL